MEGGLLCCREGFSSFLAPVGADTDEPILIQAASLKAWDGNFTWYQNAMNQYRS
jgi:hypothetical protein